MTDLSRHFQHMALATFVAYRALQNGETPVACVLVHAPTQKVLSYGCNDTNRSLNGTRHAEFMAYDKIMEENDLLGQSAEHVRAFFAEVVLYVTIEPCVMCALAIQQMGIKKVYFGAANDRFGGNGTVIKVQGDNSYRSFGGIMRVEAVHLLRNFYIQENDSAPVPKIKKNKDIDAKEFPPNLDFGKYVSRDEFVAEYGERRADEFYTANPDQEITPQIDTAYSISDLITVESVRQVPRWEELYPAQEPTIQEDITLLASMLPSVLADGRVRFGEARKRKHTEV